MRKLLSIKFAFASTYILITVLLVSGVSPSLAHAWSKENNVCKGIRGVPNILCNAYCNALKCGTDHQRASDKACDTLQYLFERNTGAELPCQDPCLNITCNDGETCVEGQCIDPCVNIICGRGEECINGECCIPSLQQCRLIPAGSICDAQTCSREGYICTEDDECCTEPEPPICRQP